MNEEFFVWRSFPAIHINRLIYFVRIFESKLLSEKECNYSFLYHFTEWKYAFYVCGMEER